MFKFLKCCVCAKQSSSWSYYQRCLLPFLLYVLISCFVLIFFCVFINWFFALGLHLDRMAKASTKNQQQQQQKHCWLVSLLLNRAVWDECERVCKTLKLNSEQHFICRCRHFQTNVFIRVCTQWCIHYGIYIALHCGSFMHIESIVVIDYCMFCFAKLLW